MKKELNIGSKCFLTLTGKVRKGFVLVIATIQMITTSWVLALCQALFHLILTTPGGWDDLLLQMRKLRQNTVSTVIQPGEGRAQIHNQDYQTSGRTDGLVLTVNRVTANMFKGLCAKLCSKHLHGLTQISVGGERKGKEGPSSQWKEELLQNLYCK